MTPFLIGGCCEAIGYIGRIQSSKDPLAHSPFIMQYLLILLAPAFMAATIYMILGRIIQLTDGDKYAIVRRSWLTGIFVTGDILSLAVQALGGVLVTSDKGTLQQQKDRKNLGKTIILVGLCIQISSFGFFVLVSVFFQYRARNHFRKLPPGLGWQKHLYTLYAVSLLILIRSIVRVVEYVQGLDGYIYSHEAFLYVFDSTLMFIAMVIMNVVHPADIARLLKEKNSWTVVSEMDRLDSAPH